MSMSISSSSLATARGVQGKTINTCKGAAQARLRAMEAQAEAARKAAEAEALIEAELAVIEECETPRKTKARRQLRRKDTFKARRKARAAKAQAHIEPTRLRAAEGEPIQNKWATPEELDALRQAWGADKRYKDRNPKPRVENIDLRAEVEVFGITKDEFDEWWAGLHANRFAGREQFDGLNETVGRLITATPCWVGSWEDWCAGEGEEAQAYVSGCGKVFKAMTYVASKLGMNVQKWFEMKISAKELWYQLGIRSFEKACEYLNGALPFVFVGSTLRGHLSVEQTKRLGQIVVALRKDELLALCKHIQKYRGIGSAMDGRVGTLAGWYSACRVWKYAPYLTKGAAVRMKNLSPKALKWFNALAKEILFGDLRDRYGEKVTYKNLLDADQYFRELSEVRPEIKEILDTFVDMRGIQGMNPLKSIDAAEEMQGHLLQIQEEIFYRGDTCKSMDYSSTRMCSWFYDFRLYGERDFAVTRWYLDDLIAELTCLQYDQLDRLFALPEDKQQSEVEHVLDWTPPHVVSAYDKGLKTAQAEEWLSALEEAVFSGRVHTLCASLKNGYSGSVTLYGQELCSYAYMLCERYVHAIKSAEEKDLPTTQAEEVTEVIPYKGYVAISCSKSAQADEYKWQEGKGVWAGATAVVSGYGEYGNLVYVNTSKGVRGSYMTGDANSAPSWSMDYGVDPAFNRKDSAICFKSDLAEKKQELNSDLVRYLLNLRSENSGVMPIRGELARVEVGDGGGWKAFLSEVTVRGERGIPELVAFAAGDLQTEKEAGLPLKELFLVRLATIALGFAKQGQSSARAAGYQWLGHYALGTGFNKVMPDAWVRPWLPEMVSGADAAGNFSWNSDRWQGQGFVDRPHGFYTVGGFSGHYNRETGLVTFKDVYDWHPMKRTSPVGMGEAELWCWSEFDLPTVDLEQLVGYLPKFCQGWAVRGLQRLGVTNVDLHAWAEKLLGSQYYGHSDFFGVKGMSNKLWHDLTAVGAKPFTTVYKGYLD